MSGEQLSVKLPDLKPLLGALRDEYRVIGQVPRDGEYIFRELAQGEEPFLGCAVTMLPPKEFLQPVRGKYYDFASDDGFSLTEPPAGQKAALFGVRPCDVYAILALDRVFSGRFEDPYYWNARRQTLIVAATCIEPPVECFCTSWGTGPSLRRDYDLLLTELADGFLVETGSDTGEAVVRTLEARPAGYQDYAEKDERVQKAVQSITKVLPVPALQLHRFLDETFHHHNWRTQADVCFSCGNCTFVCPTCYCFDVLDKPRPSFGTGERDWEWDSCQLQEFSEVAMKHNFRPTRLDRFQHRAIHKLSWMKEQYGLTGCVGCGRCVRWCPSFPIRRGRVTGLADPVEIVADLLE